MMRWLVVIAALALGGCSKKIVCDADGMIIVADDDVSREGVEWTSRKLNLALRRLGDATGMEPVPDYLRGSLAKAQGCP